MNVWNMLSNSLWQVAGFAVLAGTVALWPVEIFAQTISWEQASLESENGIHSMFAHPAGFILLATTDAMLRSEDHGLSWDSVGVGRVNSYACNDDEVIVTAGYYGVHRSFDLGQTWTEVMSKPPYWNCDGDLRQFTGIGFYSRDSLFVVGIDEGSSGTCKPLGTFHVSADLGQNWKRLSSIPDPRVLLITPRKSIFIADDGGAVYRLSPITGSPTFTGMILRPSAIAMLSNSSDLIFGASGAPLWLRHKPGTGVYRSSDRGETWQQVNTGLTDTTITSLVAHSDGHLFAGTESGGVFRSTNNGDSWEPVNMGLDDLEITALAISDEGILYAGTKNGKVYRTEGTVVSSEPGAELPSAYRLGRNYPNPFNPSTTIPFTLPEAAHVTLSVYDLLGKEVATLVSGTLPAGEHTATFSAADVATGVYLYRLTAGGYMETRRMAVVR